MQYRKVRFYFSFTGRHSRRLHPHLHGPTESLLRHAHGVGEGQGLQVEAGEGDDEALPRAEGVARVRHGVRRRFRRREDLRSALPSSPWKADHPSFQVSISYSVYLRRVFAAWSNFGD